MRRTGKGLFVICLVFVMSCANITINVYFPAEKIQKAADVIEDRVRGRVLEQEQTEEAVSPQSNACDFILDLFCSTAYAQEKVDLDINTPAIEKITQQRKKRFDRIDDLLSKGVAGEGRDGFLKERDLRSLPLKEVAEARKLIKEENDDRRQLYKEIAKANDIPMEDLEKIGENFAVTIREKLRKGQYYENDKGQWVQK
jgi:uncharacterized protein YdbL (DUF1318 family)